jgi:hypothetical protein
VVIGDFASPDGLGVREELGRVSDLTSSKQGGTWSFWNYCLRQAAVNMIPVSLAGFHLADYIIPAAEISGHEYTTHLVGMVRDTHRASSTGQRAGAPKESRWARQLSGW